MGGHSMSFLHIISLYVLFIILGSFHYPIRSIIQVCVLLSQLSTIAPSHIVSPVVERKTGFADVDPRVP